MLLITSTANIKTLERDYGLYGGLSPLARGTRFENTTLILDFRFIPAGAGNSMGQLSSISYTSVYPRWRGELVPCLPLIIVRAGLSPLARGTHDSRLATRAYLRFIPAGAGNS